MTSHKRRLLRSTELLSKREQTVRHRPQAPSVEGSAAVVVVSSAHGPAAAAGNTSSRGESGTTSAGADSSTRFDVSLSAENCLGAGVVAPLKTGISTDTRPASDLPDSLKPVLAVGASSLPCEGGSDDSSSEPAGKRALMAENAMPRL